MIKRVKNSHLSFRFLVILGIIFAVSMIFFSVLVSAKDRKDAVPAYKYYTSVQISQGDTLWDIAEKYCGDPDQRKDYVDELKEINHLSGDTIYAGRYLTVFYYSDVYQ